MLGHRTILAAVMAAGILQLSTLWAADENATPAVDFSELVKQLDSALYAERQAATEELSKAGRDAIPALIKAAGSKRREVATRAVRILGQHFENVEPLKEEAKAALEKIAAGKNPVAARLARKTLDPPKPPPVAPGRLQVLGGGQIQIQIRAVAGNGRRVQTRIVNGVKQIEAEEKGRRVKIVDDPNNGIKIEITEKKDGKETTKRFEAKDANDLKKQSPEAHKVYEQYTKQGIQVRGLQLQPGRVLQIRPAQIRRLAIPRIAEVIEQAGTELAEAIERIEKALENDRDTDTLKKALEQLEQVKKRLDDAKENLGG
jgi:hypothetical protein